jgi:hypothetical protein
MFRKSILLVSFVVIIVGQDLIASETITTTDSLPDVFPLSIGNEWTYSYSLDSYDEIAWSYKVNGSVGLRIIEKSIVGDSIVWCIKKTNDLISDHNGLMYHDTSTSTFNFVEIQSGDHRILSPGFPFYSMPFDSTSITRYSAVDSSGSYSFVLEKGRMKYTYTFKEEIGALSYSAMDMCICLDYWNASYDLTNYQINAVETNQEMNNIIEFKLEQNYPNPFNPLTIINYKLPADGWVMIKVYDILGREVAILVNEAQKFGKHEVEFNGSKLSSGVYFYILQTANYMDTKKLLLMK